MDESVGLDVPVERPSDRLSVFDGDLEANDRLKSCTFDFIGFQVNEFLFKNNNNNNNKG